MAGSDSETRAGDTKVGRSYADFGVEIIQIMGKLGPVTIIVAGLLFAFYMFYQALADAQLKADQQNQQKLDAAQKALVETYESISTLSQKQIANVQQMLDLHDELAKATEDRRTQLGKIQDKAEEDAKIIRAEAEAARAEARTARAEVAALTAAASALRAEADAARSEARTTLAQAEAAKREAEVLRAEAQNMNAAAVTAKAEAEAARALADAAKTEAKNARAESEAALAERNRTQAEVEAAQENADAAKTELMTLNEQMRVRRDRAQQELEKLEADRNKLQAERDKVKAELDKRRQTLQARADEIERLKAQLEELATQVASKTAGTTGPSDEGERLAQEILDQDVFQTPLNLLHAAAETRDRASLESLNALVGLKEEILRPLLEEGLGFEAWLRFEDPEEPSVAYLGVLESTDSAHISPVFFVLDEGRVLDVTSAQRVFALRLQDTEDWNRSWIVAYLEAHEGDLEREEVVFDARLDSWNLETVLRASAEEFGDTLIVKRLSGQIADLDFLTVDDFSKGHPEAFADLRYEDEYSAGIELGRRMTRRAQSFDASALAGMNHLEPFPGLPERFAGLLSAAVDRDPSAQDYLAPYATPRRAVGAIAAAVLGDDFSIDAATSLAPGQDIAQQQVPATPEEESVWILATALGAQREDALQRYAFNFVRGLEADAAWNLLDFSIESDTGRRGTLN
jgi:hypothetical protein